VCLQSLITNDPSFLALQQAAAVEAAAVPESYDSQKSPMFSQKNPSLLSSQQAAAVEAAAVL